MLRNLGIRSKILATLSIPVLLLLIVAGVLVKDSVDQRAIAKSYANTLDASGGFFDLVHAVQAERSLSMAVLSGDITKQPVLVQTRSAISEGLAKMETVDSNGSAGDSRVATEGVLKIWDQVRAFQANLQVIRKRIDAKQITAAQVNAQYSKAVEELLRIPSALGQEFPVLTMQRALNTVSVNETATEALMRERDALTPILTVGGYTSAAEQQAARMAIMRRVVTAEAAQANATALEGAIKSTPALTAIENKLLALPVGQDPGITTAQLNAATDTASGNLKAFQVQVYDVAKAEIQGVIDDATQRVIWTILGSALVLASMFLLALYMSRTISAPLRRLTAAVTRVHTKLPEMVNRDNPDQKIVLTDDMVVPIESNDEVGRLASSFNDVSRAVVDTANSQAELRSSIAGMFVNVARRDQTLLSRQLSLIDQLERTEEDPQTLSTLFKLDHLSTRMRRNAEALLVLAGIDTGRRLRRAMALSDVVRTASSEIEHYDRVDLVQTVDPQMLGHTALSASSMLAELLENATAFSDPNSRVSVRTENSPNGIAVIITDEGLGMTPAEVDDANKKIASVSLAEVVASKRIGFFVVGRLARRLESTVVVSRAAGKGTMVRVEFPPQVFVPGAVTHVKAAPADPAGAPAAKPALPAQATAPALPAATPSPAAPSAPAARPAAATAPSAPAAGATAAAGAAAAAARRDSTSKAQPAAPAARTKPDAEERLSRAAKPLTQRPGKPETIPPAAPQSPAATAKPADATSTAQPAPGLAKREQSAAPAPAAKPTLPQRGRQADRPTAPAAKDGSATDTSPTKKAAAQPAGDTAGKAGAGQPKQADVPEPRNEGQPARGGLFSGFRRTREAMPESPAAQENAKAAPQDAAPAAPGKPAGTQPAQPSAPQAAESAKTAAPQASPAPKAPAAADPAPAGQTGRAATPTPAPPVAAPQPASPATADQAPSLPARAPQAKPAAAQADTTIGSSGSRNILPGGARKPQQSRGGGSLFSRLGDPSANLQDQGRQDQGRGDQARADQGRTEKPSPAAAPAPGNATRPQAQPTVPAAQPSAAAAPGLPARRAPEDAPVQPVAPAAQAASSGFAAEALSELSRLQAYRPSTMATGTSAAPPSTLVRRQAGATPAGQLPPTPRPQPSARRSRSAADVRSMLSGFQAGVERGRTTATDAQPEADEKPST